MLKIKHFYDIFLCKNFRISKLLTNFTCVKKIS